MTTAEDALKLAGALRAIAVDIDNARCRDRGDLADDLVGFARRLLNIAVAHVPPLPADEIDTGLAAADALLVAEDTRAAWMASFAAPQPRTQGKAELAHHRAKGDLVVKAERYREAKERNAAAEDVRRAG